ncbi:MAG: hypothetical protein MJZ90_04235 [Bacteroidales bacterium]|nr:hypothetical protein [Bacteroidales bacterium]
MKKLVICLIASVFTGLFLSSCEKQCVCYNYTTNSSAVMYNSYSKSDCNDWDKYYKTDTHINPQGHNIECLYEKK